MLKIPFRLLLFLFIVLFPGSTAFAAFQLTGQQNIDVGAKALDVAVSQDGKWTFVLTAGGTVQVLSWKGQKVQTINTGGDYERIEFATPGNRLILSGGDSTEILVVVLDLIHEIDISGSPFKGPVNAPVIIAVFSDYQ